MYLFVRGYMEDMEDNINTPVDTLKTLSECSQCLVVLGTDCGGVSLYLGQWGCGGGRIRRFGSFFEDLMLIWAMYILVLKKKYCIDSREYYYYVHNFTTR